MKRNHALKRHKTSSERNFFGMNTIFAFVESKNGVDTAIVRWNDKTYTAACETGSTLQLSRELVAAGVPDGELIALSAKDGDRLFRLPSIHEAAKRSINEGKSGEELRKFRAGPAARHGDDDDGTFFAWVLPEAAFRSYGSCRGLSV